MASFQAKKCLKSTRKRENKNFISVTFLPDGKYKTPKKEKQNKKKSHCGFISSQNQMEKVDYREKIKIIVSFRSYLTCNRKLKKIAKKF